MSGFSSVSVQPSIITFMHLRYLPLVATLALPAAAQTLSPTVDSYVKVKGPRTVLRHVRVIDGTGSPARDDQDVFVTDGKIIRIATLNGAIYEGKEKQIGSIAVGKNADFVVVKGDPGKRIDDIENVELVFKDGLGYDSAKLLDSVKGRYGQY